MRRLEAHQTRYAAGLAYDRQIGIVHRLEHDDLVAGLDDGQNGDVSASVPPEVTITSVIGSRARPCQRP